MDKLDRQAVAALVGDAQKLAEEMTQFQKDWEILENRWQELLQTHPYKWIAVVDGKVSLADSYIDCVRALGETASRAAMGFLDPNPPHLLLAVA